MSFLDFLFISLASWRVTNLLVNEDGPFDIFLKLRNRLIPEGEVSGFLPILFSCIYCLSIYVACLIYLSWLITPIPAMLLSASTVVILVDRYR